MALGGRTVDLGPLAFLPLRARGEPLEVLLPVVGDQQGRKLLADLILEDVAADTALLAVVALTLGRADHVPGPHASGDALGLTDEPPITTVAHRDAAERVDDLHTAPG